MTEKEKAALIEKLKEIRDSQVSAPCDTCMHFYQGDSLNQDIGDLIYDIERDLLVCEVKA